MRQRTVAPPESVADWPAPNRGDPFDLFEVGAAGAGREPAGRARPRGVREPCAAQAAAGPQVRPARLRRGRAARHPGRHRAGPRRHPRRRRAAPARRSTAGPTASAISAISATTISIARRRALTGLARAGAGRSGLRRPATPTRRGRPLSGANRYELTFPADGLPPARAFWSLAMYEVTPDGRAFFIDNPIGRYAIGDRTPGLQKAARRLAHSLSAARAAGRRARGQLAARAGRADAAGAAGLRARGLADRGPLLACPACGATLRPEGR